MMRGMTEHRLILHISLALAALYNVILLLLYWRRLEPRSHRYAVVVFDLCLVTTWVYLAASNGRDVFTFRDLFTFYYLVVIVAGVWFGVIGTLATAAMAGALYLVVIVNMPALTPFVMSDALGRQLPFLILVAIVMGYLAEARQREHEQWAETRDFLVRYQERVRMSQSIYELHVPQRLPQVPGLDLGLRFRPALRMGAGDYYEVVPLSPQRTGIGIADVAGMQAPAVIKVPLFRGYFHAAATLFSSPREVLDRVNAWIYPDLQPDMFISLAYLVVDLDQRELICANAGHDPPLLCRADTKETVALITGDMVLGVLPATRYRETSTPIAPGDYLLLYTDGAAGATSPEGDEFGQERMEAALVAGVGLGLGAQALADRIFRLVNDFARGGQRRDDITVMVIRLPDDAPAGPATDPPATA
jgi:serine phosphatase RsbU (regulator of sigma subunit)